MVLYAHPTYHETCTIRAQFVSRTITCYQRLLQTQLDIHVPTTTCTTFLASRRVNIMILGMLMSPHSYLCTCMCCFVCLRNELSLYMFIVLVVVIAVHSHCFDIDTTHTPCTDVFKSTVPLQSFSSIPRYLLLIVHLMTCV